MKVRALLVALIAAGWAAVANADSPRVSELVQGATGTFETTWVGSFTANFATPSGFGPGNILYGFDVLTTAASGWCALYDASSTSSVATTQGIFIDEGREATSTDPWVNVWPAPYRLQTGLVVECVDAKAIIYHDVKS